MLLSVIQQECIDTMKKGEAAILVQGCNVRCGNKIYPKAMIEKLCSMGFIKKVKISGLSAWKHKKHIY